MYGERERLRRHYAGHQEISSSATSARALGFDYGEDFEQSCHLNYNVARHQENQVGGQVQNTIYIYIYISQKKFKGLNHVNLFRAIQNFSRFLT